MADIKISELTAVSSLNNDDLVEVSQVNALAPSGYTSLKASMTDLGKKVNSDIEYTTDLADFTDKTTLGAIKETAKGKNITDEYDDTQTYDKGDVVIYKNTLYICTTNNTTGTWDASKWTATTIDNIIGSLSTLTTTDKSSLVGAVNEVDGDISDLQTNKSNLLEYFTVAVSVPYGNARYKSVDVNIARTGYTALGVVGYNLTSIDNIVFACRMTSATVVSFGIQTRDGSNSSATISGYINVLYVKN